MLDKSHLSYPKEVLASMEFMKNTPDFPQSDPKMRRAYAKLLHEFLKCAKLTWTEQNLSYAWKSIRRPN